MTDELKTLRDLDFSNCTDIGYDDNENPHESISQNKIIETLKALAIKRAKENKKAKSEFVPDSCVWHEFNGRMRELMNFFNLTKDDLK